MGNQSSASSCYAASSCTISSSLLSSSSYNTSSSINGGDGGGVLQPCAMAKVLLLDGRVLHFRHKVRAIQVLLNHPNHCLCPAESLHTLNNNAGSRTASPNYDSITTLLRPISLLPDDRLQPGRIYILLPLRTFHLFAAAAAAAAAHKGKITAAKRSRAAINNTNRIINNASTQACTDHPPSHQQAASAISSSNHHPCRRSLDLQPPRHRRSVSSSMRRCRSWRPRLQAINEVHVY